MKYACLLMVLFAILGCGKTGYEAYEDSPAYSAPSSPMDSSYEGEASADSGELKPGVGTALADAKALQRKIIYTADVELVVEDFDPIPAKVAKLAADFGGIVASSAETGSAGHRRTGRWTLRVPVSRYGECLVAVKALGELRDSRSDSKDVSEEYFDLDARIKNKQKQEARLLELLSDATGKLEEVLRVERELARVREEIERMQGRMRVLNNLTSLTTIELTVEEIKGYVPEKAPTYSTRVRRAWDGSLNALVSAAASVSIALVALAPWIGVFLVPVIVIVLVLRRCCRR